MTVMLSIGVISTVSYKLWIFLPTEMLTEAMLIAQ